MHTVYETRRIERCPFVVRYVWPILSGSPVCQKYRDRRVYFSASVRAYLNASGLGVIPDDPVNSLRRGNPRRRAHRSMSADSAGHWEFRPSHRSRIFADSVENRTESEEILAGGIGTSGTGDMRKINLSDGIRRQRKMLDR